MRRVLPIVLLSGCWPHLSGDWTDYLAPGDTDLADTDTDGADTDTDGSGDSGDTQDTSSNGLHLVGDLYWRDFLGDYWGSTGGEGEIDLGWIDPQYAGDDPLDGLYYAPDDNDCGKSTNAAYWLQTHSAIKTGSSGSVQGPRREIPLEWDPTYDDYSSTLSLSDVSSTYGYDLLDTSVGKYTVTATNFAHLPSPYTYKPDLDTSSPPKGDSSSLKFTWTPTGDADYVQLTVILVDANDRDLETYSCRAPESKGRVYIPQSMWTKEANGSYWYIELSAIKAVRVPLEGIDGYDSIVYARRISVGAVDLP